MGLVYLLAVGVVGTATVDFMDTLIADKLYNLVANWLTNLNASPWAISLVCDGIISGVGAVLNFVPQLMILFLLLAVLETSGYMSRITFFLDKVFRLFTGAKKNKDGSIVGGASKNEFKYVSNSKLYGLKAEMEQYIEDALLECEDPETLLGEEDIETEKQLEKDAGSFIDGEGLDILVGSMPYTTLDNDETDLVKKNV